MMTIAMCAQAGRLLEGHAADVAAKVLLLVVEKLVLLQGALAEESLGAEGAHKPPTLLLLLPAGVHALPRVRDLNNIFDRKLYPPPPSEKFLKLFIYTSLRHPAKVKFGLYTVKSPNFDRVLVKKIFSPNFL
jgi:hypothetical protein